MRKRTSPMVRFDANTIQEFANTPLMFSNRLAQSNQLAQTGQIQKNTNQPAKQVSRIARDASSDQEYDSDRQAFAESKALNLRPNKLTSNSYYLDKLAPKKDKSNCPPFIYDELPSFMVNDKSKYSIFNDNSFQQKPTYLKSAFSNGPAESPASVKRSPMAVSKSKTLSNRSQNESNWASTPVSDKPARKKLTALSVSHSASKPHISSNDSSNPPMLPSQPPPSLSYLSLGPAEFETTSKKPQIKKNNRKRVADTQRPDVQAPSSPKTDQPERCKKSANKKACNVRKNVQVPIEKTVQAKVNTKRPGAQQLAHNPTTERTRNKSGSSIHCVNRELVPHRCFCTMNEKNTGFSSSNITHSIHESTSSTTANSSCGSNCSNVSHEFTTQIKIIKISSANQIITSDGGSTTGSQTCMESGQRTRGVQAEWRKSARDLSFGTFPVNYKNVKLLSSSMAQTSLPALSPEMNSSVSLYSGDLSKKPQTTKTNRPVSSANSLNSMNAPGRSANDVEEYDNDLSTPSQVYSIQGSPNLFRMARYDYQNHDLHFV